MSFDVYFVGIESEDQNAVRLPIRAVTLPITLKQRKHR